MGWSTKYKKSIDCSNPKGFSQKAHCAGRKKRQKENTIRKRVEKRPMKITEEDREKIKNHLTEKHNIREGIVDLIFGKTLSKKLKNDKEFVKLAKKVDTSMDDLRKKVEDMEKEGEKIPSSYKKILNIK